MWTKGLSALCKSCRLQVSDSPKCLHHLGLSAEVDWISKCTQNLTPTAYNTSCETRSTVLQFFERTQVLCFTQEWEGGLMHCPKFNASYQLLTCLDIQP